MRGQAGKGSLALSLPGCQTLVAGVRLRRCGNNLARVHTAVLNTLQGLGLQDNSEDSLERNLGACYPECPAATPGFALERLQRFGRL